MKKLASEFKSEEITKKWVSVDGVVGLCNNFQYNKYDKYMLVLTKDGSTNIELLTNKIIEIIDAPKNFSFKKIINRGNDGSYKSGTDPEFFVEGDGEIIPAFTFLGNKKDTMCITENGARVYWDGFQAEFETIPKDCHGWSVDEIQYGLKTLLTAARKVNKDAVFSSKTLIQVTQDQLDKALPEHKAFGCMPSFNAYNMKGLSIPGEVCPYRSAGGHIHMGMGKQTEASSLPIVKMLDNIIGVVGVSCFAKYDDPRRRRMYGLAGEYRLPEHGIEYRVLSNAWMFHPLTANIFLDLTRVIWYAFKYNMSLDWIGNEEETIHIINNCDVKGSRYVMERNKKLILELIESCYNDKSISLMVYELLINGADTFVSDDISKNWLLDDGWIKHSDGRHANVKKYHDNIYTKQKKQEVS